MTKNDELEAEINQNCENMKYAIIRLQKLALELSKLEVRILKCEQRIKIHTQGV